MKIRKENNEELSLLLMILTVILFDLTSNNNTWTLNINSELTRNI